MWRYNKWFPLVQNGSISISIMNILDYKNRLQNISTSTILGFLLFNHLIKKSIFNASGANASDVFCMDRLGGFYEGSKTGIGLLPD